jgi:RNA-directed DNA polymerase
MPSGASGRSSAERTMLNDRSLGADVLRTSECGLAASKRPPSRSLLDGLTTDGPWLAAVDGFRTRHPRRRDRIADYERILDTGAHLRIGAGVLAGRHRPAPPAERWLNKADGRKKRIFQYPPADELLFRVMNRLLQPAAAEAASPWCRSFLPGGGARAAFRGVLADPDVEGKAALRLDVRDYFNSIDVADLLSRLPDPFDSGPVADLLAVALLDRRVERHDGTVGLCHSKGVMAGTPLAPLLATLYLRDLDHEVASTGATYARYSDDILVLAPSADLPGLERLIRDRLGDRGLQVNESKSAVTAPGQPWDFLGFRYSRGSVGLSPITERKLKTRTTRLARSLLRWREQTGAAATPERTARAFLRRTNLRLYGVPAERADFSWATWFLPMLNSPDDLHPLDAHVQREARYAATGRRTERARRLLPYPALVEAGHLPLVPAFWTLHEEGVPAYDALVARRARLA